MEAHTEMGHHILAGSDVDLLDLAALMALTHHERIDGTGYPAGLKGDAIPIEGRIAPSPTSSTHSPQIGSTDPLSRSTKPAR